LHEKIPNIGFVWNYRGVSAGCDILVGKKYLKPFF
jgi:hypothetical protein